MKNDKNNKFNILIVSDNNYHDKSKLKKLISGFVQYSEQENLILKISTVAQTNFDMYIKTVCLQQQDKIIYTQYTNVKKTKSVYCCLQDALYDFQSTTRNLIKNQSMVNKISITSNDIIIFLIYNSHGITTPHIKKLYNLAKKHQKQIQIMVQSK